MCWQVSFKTKCYHTQWHENFLPLCEYFLILNLKLCLVHAHKGYAYLKKSAFMLSRFCFSDSVLSSVVYVKEALHIEEMSQINLCLKCQISFQL